MLEIFVYPVSAVMKLWHLLLADVIGLEKSLAWTLSVLGLVIIIRSLIAPLFLIQMRSSRIMSLMRPELSALAKEYKTRTDKDSMKEFEQRRKEIQQRYNFKASAGCLPALIQFPAFIGLYQVLIRMARPSEGLESNQHRAIGFLTPQDVSEFLDSRIADVPLPAYASMTPQQFAELGTTKEAVLGFLWPLLIIAVVATMVNLLLSVRRTRPSLDWDSKVARFSLKLTYFMLIFIPLMLFSAGLTGPIPMAIIVYWVANNLWTLIQSAVIDYKLEKEMPYSPEYRAARKAHLREHRERMRTKRSTKWWRRRTRVKGILPTQGGQEARTQLREHKAEVKAEKQRAKEEKKRLRKAKLESLQQANREKAAQKKAEQEASSENDAAAEVESVGPQAPEALPDQPDASADTPSDKP